MGVRLGAAAKPQFLDSQAGCAHGTHRYDLQEGPIVKFMFFNEDDVKWFMPVDLFTRLGRQGRIIKAVGTHGMFKASFNDTVFQHDMICMSLYKRVFPKWRTVAYNEAEILLPALTQMTTLKPSNRL